VLFVVSFTQSRAKELPPTVLIVEDEFFVRFTTAEFLRDDGFEVLEAENADEALGILKSGAPVDLLFTDVRMPGSMDGVALATLVRREWPRIPIILTSGYAPELLSARSVAEDRVISKPYRQQAVVAAIRSFFEEVAPNG
jgi:CheY-like chemotaxis protein